MRTGAQDSPGNPGRGVVFPHAIAPTASTTAARAAPKTTSAHTDAASMSLVARAMSPTRFRGRVAYRRFLNELAEIHRGSCQTQPSAPAHADSVCAAFGLAWRRLSRRQMRAAPRASRPTIGHTAIMSKADKREGIQFAGIVEARRGAAEVDVALVFVAHHAVERVHRLVRLPKGAPPIIR